MKRALSVHSQRRNMQLVQCDMFSRFFDGIYEKYVDSKELCYRHIIGDVTNIQYPLKNDHKFAKKNHIFTWPTALLAIITRSSKSRQMKTRPLGRISKTHRCSTLCYKSIIKNLNDSFCWRNCVDSFFALSWVELELFCCDGP